MIRGSYNHVVGITFTLVHNSRTFPVDFDDFEGRFIGRIKILYCRDNTQHKLETKEVTAFLNLPSCAPYYVYSTTVAEIRTVRKHGSVSKQIHMDFKAKACGYVLKEELDKRDMEWLSFEITHPFNKNEKISTEYMAIAKGLRENMSEDDRVLRSEFEQEEFYERVVAHKCDIYRLDFVSALMLFMVNNRQDSEQRKTIRSMEPVMLKSAYNKLKRVPWEMVFGQQTRKLYNLHGLSQTKYYNVFRFFGKDPRRIPAMVDLSVRIYFYMQQQRSRGGHTCFEKLQILRDCIRVTRDTPKVIDSAFAYLCNKAISWVDEETKTLVAFPEDLTNANSICNVLKTVCERHNDFEIEVPRGRGVVVPIIPPYELTQDQKTIARHIESQAVTVVEGLPGTGKTALVTWCMNRYINVMLVSFISMMVKTLQRRCGHHTEAAHTIHHVITFANMTMHSDLWLNEFDVLVVDEFSNVEASLFASLVRVLPNLKKIVVVGDHEQLFPIGPGDPMGCLVDVFGSQRLTQVLRVEEGKHILSTAPKLISDGQAHMIRFASTLEEDAALTILPKPRLLSAQEQREPSRFRARQAIYPLIKRIKELPGGDDVMNIHVVVLLNTKEDGRKVLNHACESVFQKLGMLKIPTNGGVKIRSGYKIYPGKKITFTKNYNKPIMTGVIDHHRMQHETSSVLMADHLDSDNDSNADDDGDTEQSSHFIYSSPISNGELVYIQTIKKLTASQGGGHLLLVSDVSKPTRDEQYKYVWLHKENGVDPQHVTDGFASTTYKIQGNEYSYVIFWMKDDPPTSEFYTREHAYVAISRGKSRVWCFGSHEDFLKLCDRKAAPRRTVLQWLMTQHIDKFQMRERCVRPTLNRKELVLMSVRDACVPKSTNTIKRKLESREKKKKKKKKEKIRKQTKLSRFINSNRETDIPVIDLTLSTNGVEKEDSVLSKSKESRK